MSVRIATFNVENLMARFDFSSWKGDRSAPRLAGLDKPLNKDELRIAEQVRKIGLEDDARQMTALAIADCHADILCLQEVENLETLTGFEKDYLFPMTGLSYPQKVWIEGNDGRGIDVALVARNETATGEKIRIINVRSHRKRSFADLDVYGKRLEKMGVAPDDRLFRRDCLEVDLKVGGRPVTLFVCHFKSMGSGRDGLTGRDYTMPVRTAEAQGVRNIIEQKFGAERSRKMRWMICGDLNDYTERLQIGGHAQQGYTFTLQQEKTSGILPLLADGFSHDLVRRRDGDNRWTLYFASGPAKNARNPEDRPVRHLVQLDYLLASPAWAGVNKKALPHIVRNGLPYRTVFPDGQEVERYPRTGWDRPKASDHCPVTVTLKAD